MGEIAMREANCADFMTVAVAPHQVYAPASPSSASSRLFFSVLTHRTCPIVIFHNLQPIHGFKQTHTRTATAPATTSSSPTFSKQAALVASASSARAPTAYVTLCFPQCIFVTLCTCFTHVDNYAHGLIIAERAL